MQCSSCRAVYSNGLDFCPRCKTPASKISTPAEPLATPEQKEEVVKSNVSAEARGNGSASASATTTSASTLIEFPGARAPLPPWRRELSERVRLIQERRARDSATEAEEMGRRRVEEEQQPPAPQLGLVPTPDAPEVNPIVAAALRRIERARQPSPPPRGHSSSRGSAAVARVAEEQYEHEAQPNLIADASVRAEQQIATAPVAKTAEPVRERSLVVVPTPAPKPETVVQPKRVFEEVLDDEVIARREAEAIAQENRFDDRAPLIRRIACGIVDLLVVVFASSPFAAFIKLTNGNWSDPRVAASMCGVTSVVLFLYLTASTGFLGRTFGMWLFSLRAVDVNNGLIPTTKQTVARAILYILSLVTLGLGLFYALFDAEGRTIHDRLSGTAVVKD